MVGVIGGLRLTASSIVLHEADCEGFSHGIRVSARFTRVVYRERRTGFSETDILLQTFETIELPPNNTS
jgi:hypothetical protein